MERIVQRILCDSLRRIALDQSRPRFEHPDLLFCQTFTDSNYVIDTIRVTYVNNQHGRVGGLQRINQPRLHVVRGDRRKINELEVDVFIRQHARLRKLGCKRIRADVSL